MTSARKRRLCDRLDQSEDPWVERKQSTKDHEVRRTVVAFANSVPEGETAVLFLGAANSKEHPGVANADKAQKEVAGHISKCYPPIRYNTAVLSVSVGGRGVEVLAIEVPFSENRPHFASGAYVRRGCETVRASEEVFRDLIASQNDKARRILQFKDGPCRLRLQSQTGFWYELDCTVESCDAHSVILREDSGAFRSFSIPNIEVLRLPTGDLQIVAPPPLTEEEHIGEMLNRWLASRPSLKPQSYQLPSDWLLKQFLANPGRVLPAVCAVADGTESMWLRLLRLHLQFALKRSDHSTPRHQKLRRLEARFAEMMQGKVAHSNLDVIAAALRAITEVSTSMQECEDFLKHLVAHHAGAAQTGFDTLWNALLWELKL